MKYQHQVCYVLDENQPHETDFAQLVSQDICQNINERMQEVAYIWESRSKGFMIWYQIFKMKDE